MSRGEWIFASIAMGCVCLFVGMVLGSIRSCPTEQKAQESPFGQGLYPKTVTYKGHMYLVVRGVHRFAITHHPDCPCRKAPKEVQKRMSDD